MEPMDEQEVRQPAGFAPPDGSVPWCCPWCRERVFWTGALEGGAWLQCISCRKMLPFGGLDATWWLDKSSWHEPTTVVTLRGPDGQVTILPGSATMETIPWRDD